MHIYLIRHATQQTDLCNVNTPLSPLGREQARALGKRLSGYSLGLLYSSGLTRAVETAQIITECIFQKEGRKLEHKIRDGMREFDFGELTGKPNEEIKKVYRNFLDSRYSCGDWAYPEGESGQEVADRAMPVIEEIVESGVSHVAVVTHGGTIRTILSHLFHNNQEHSLFFGKWFQRASITELYFEKENNRFYLERFNDYAHLEERNLIEQRHK